MQLRSITYDCFISERLRLFILVAAGFLMAIPGVAGAESFGLITGQPPADCVAIPLAEKRKFNCLIIAPPAPVGAAQPRVAPRSDDDESPWRWLTEAPAADCTTLPAEETRKFELCALGSDSIKTEARTLSARFRSAGEALWARAEALGQRRALLEGRARALAGPDALARIAELRAQKDAILAEQKRFALLKTFNALPPQALQPHVGAFEAAQVTFARLRAPAPLRSGPDRASDTVGELVGGALILRFGETPQAGQRLVMDSDGRLGFVRASLVVDLPDKTEK